MTKCEKIDLLMQACTISRDYYKEKAQTDGISATEWITYMDLIDNYDKLYTSLILDYFTEFAKEIG